MRWGVVCALGRWVRRHVAKWRTRLLARRKIMVINVLRRKASSPTPLPQRGELAPTAPRRTPSSTRSLARAFGGRIADARPRPDGRLPTLLDGRRHLQYLFLH